MGRIGRGHRLLHGPPDPPPGVCRESTSPIRIETVDGLDETNRAGLHRVQESGSTESQHPSPQDDKPKTRRDQLVTSRRFPMPRPHGKFVFGGRPEWGYGSEPAQIWVHESSLRAGACRRGDPGGSCGHRTPAVALGKSHQMARSRSLTKWRVRAVHDAVAQGRRVHRTSGCSPRPDQSGWCAEVWT